MKTVGVDCAGLVICIARELGLVEHDFDINGYAPTPDGVSMQAACDQFMTRVQWGQVMPGDVLLIRFASDPQHMAIVADYLHGGLSMIHADMRASPPRVLEMRLADVWRARVIQAYRLPGVAA